MTDQGHPAVIDSQGYVRPYGGTLTEWVFRAYADASKLSPDLRDAWWVMDREWLDALAKATVGASDGGRPLMFQALLLGIRVVAPPDHVEHCAPQLIVPDQRNRALK